MKIVSAAMALILSFTAVSKSSAQAGDRSALWNKFTTLGMTASKQGHYSCAEKMFREALERTSTSDKTKLAASLCNLADAYVQQGYYWNAEPIYHKLIPLIQANPSLYRNQIAASISSYKDLLRVHGQNTKLKNIEAQSQLLDAAVESYSTSQKVGTSDTTSGLTPRL